VDVPWEDPDWRATAVAWADDRLAAIGRPRTGDIDQFHVRPWSTVIRLPTADGPTFFKANAPELRHEAVVTHLVSRQVPERTPPLLGDDLDRGWMLMDDAGVRIREVLAEERDLSRWYDVLEGAADIARALEPDVGELLAAGVPDMRLAVLPDLYHDLVHRLDVEQRFRDAVPRVRDLAEELASYGLAETLQHDDLHDGQVFVDGDVQRILDWGDCCVSHPFFTLSVSLEGFLAWGLDDVESSIDIAPYVARYLTRYAPDRPELADAIPVALRLGWACRAVNAHQWWEDNDDNQTLARLRMFLDGRA
jgi:hypothetical protein